MTSRRNQDADNDAEDNDAEPGRGKHRTRFEDDTDILPVIGDAGFYADSPATGLAKFDLGTIPASVTPPRSWRHAAWFAVASAILVLVGLTYAAVALMTGPRKPDVVEALPGLPSQRLPPPTESPTDQRVRPSPEISTSFTTTTLSPARLTVSRTLSVSSATTTTSTTTGGGTALTPKPTSTLATTVSTPPSRSTVSSPTLVASPVDPATMGDRTEAYYREVTENPDAAYALTAGSMRRAGQEEIERRYADVERVEVVRIVIDPNRAKTRSTLRIIRKDGSVTTEERELTFTRGADPRISNERLTA